MLGKTLVGSGIASIVILAVVLQTTTPATIGPLGILLVFILMYIAALSVLTFLIIGGNRLLLRSTVSLTTQRPLRAISLRRAYYFASVISLAPVMFIGMQSVSEVTVYDALLVVAFVTMACVYVAKRAH